jgi:hypothetical protein
MHMSWLFWTLLIVGLVLIIWPFLAVLSAGAAVFLWVLGAVLLFGALVVALSYWSVRPARAGASAGATTYGGGMTGSTGSYGYGEPRRGEPYRENRDDLDNRDRGT